MFPGATPRRPVASIAVVLAAAVAMLVPELEAAPGARGWNDYAVTTWNEDEGLFASRITVLEQDGDGYLWLGTDIGLLRFDGVRFEAAASLAGPGLPPGEITALLSARDGSLWIAVAAAPGLARLRNGALEMLSAQDGPGGFVSSMLQDGAGHIWVGSSLGLSRFADGRFHAVQLPADVGRAVVALYEDRTGALWVATRDAVLRRDRADSAFRTLDRLHVSSNVWQRFSEAPDGTVWMTDFERGFRRAEPADSMGAAKRGWGASVLHDRRGNFWVATHGQGLWRGLGSHRPEDLDVITIRDGLASDAVQCLFEDREGNVWAGTHAGLQRLTPHKVTPLSDLPLARAMASAPDGSVWVGSTTGLTRISRAGRQRYGEAEGLPGSVVLAVHAAEDGTIWVTTERGIARFANGRFLTSVLEPGADLGRGFSIARHDDSLWVRDVDFRLARMSERGERLPADGVPRAYLRSTTVLETDTRGRLWIGTVSGHVGVRSPGGAFESVAAGVGVVNAIYDDAAGVVWIGGEGGVARLQNGEVTVVGPRHGLQSVRALVEDQQGVLWVGLMAGIARLEKSEFARAASSGEGVRYRLFNSADGAAGRPMTLGSRTAVRATDGRLWFATSGGVTIVDPLAIGEPRPAAPARIAEMTVDARRIRESGEPRLPPRPPHVQFAFTALTLTDATRVQFRYRLDGFDTDWVQSGTVRQASYTNLPPGEYRFHVQANNGDGRWSMPDTLAFSIAPAFYQTRWFSAVGLFAVVAGIAVGWQLHVRRVRRRFALVLGERIRMSRAIHDTLLQGLAGMALQLDDVSHTLEESSPLRDRIRAMRQHVEEYIRDARQSIWDLRNPRPHARSLADVLGDAARRTVGNRPVAVDVAVRGTPVPPSPAAEEQLVRICQEAVSNAVTHGEAARIRIELTYRNDELRMRVEDDGCGFDEPTVARVAGQRGHYGMLSMRERAADVSGTISVVSAPGTGTTVEVAVPQ